MHTLPDYDLNQFRIGPERPYHKAVARNVRPEQLMRIGMSKR
jgi:hypothetical protein